MLWSEEWRDFQVLVWTALILNNRAKHSEESLNVFFFGIMFIVPVNFVLTGNILNVCEYGNIDKGPQ